MSSITNDHRRQPGRAVRAVLGAARAARPRVGHPPRHPGDPVPGGPRRRRARHVGARHRLGPARLDRHRSRPGRSLVVVGRLRRRFYQRPGGVGSRVDVEAELVGRARDRRRIDAALRKALRALEVLG